MKHLTAKQMEIFVWIERFINKNNYAPTFREVSGHFKVAVKCVADHIEAIENKGYIRRIPKVSRGIIIEKIELRGIPREKVEKICDFPDCGKIFKTKRNSQRYCSPYCERLHSGIKKEENDMIKKEERRLKAEKIRRELHQLKKEEYKKSVDYAKSQKRSSGLLISRPRMQEA